ncbi:WXG100 family type VII secretion target [Streptomyces sp. NPDC002795]|uniref:WXG100 family type VII secretion target n=1 Tax=Streptomyces sp. NPDC002795 TaxID=3364665 RepID=UPI0036C0D1F0
MTGYSVEPEVLRASAKSIKDAVAVVDKVHLDKLADDTPEFGHGDASDVYGELLATWHQALTKALKDGAEGSADGLKDVADRYERNEGRTAELVAQRTGDQ